MAKSNELKACPFCGAKAELLETIDGYADEIVFISCTSCKTTGGQSDSHAGATELWNTRQPDLEVEQDSLEIQNESLESEIAYLENETINQLKAKREQAEVKIEKLITGIDKVNNVGVALRRENVRLKGVLEKIKTLHNLLPFIAKGVCRCDPDVGAVPCESCAANEILKEIEALNPEQKEE